MIEKEKEFTFNFTKEDMAEKTPKTVIVIEHMLESLKNPIKKLTSWELTFIASLTEQFEKRRSLSDKQFDVLERIYAEKTA